jgi:DNA-binding response OmpR family regulator
LHGRVGDLAVPRDSRVLQCGGKFVPLTPSEYKVFQLLMGRVGQPVRRAQLLQQLATHKPPPTSNMAEVYILYLRRKLAAVGSRSKIVTLRGVGYMLTTGHDSETESEADPRRNSSGPA